MQVDGYSVRSLINRHNDQPMGIIALHKSHFTEEGLDPETAVVISHLLRRAEIAVEDRRLQLDVFAALQPILPDIEVMQALQGTVPYVITTSGQRVR